MYTNMRRTSSSGLCLVDEAVKYCDSDLEVVSMEGAVMKTSKIHLALASHSPLLKDILTSDTPPSRLLVPDVPTQSLHHLLNLLTQGYTTGPGSGDGIIKGMKEAAKVLGLVKFPVIAFEVEGNQPGWPSDKNVIQWSTERSEAEKDRNEIVQIDIEDNGDDEERESSDAREGELMQQSNTLKVLSVGDINKKHLNDSVGDKNEKHLNDSVGDINKKHLTDSVGVKNKKHLIDSVGDINKKHLNDQQNENQPQKKRRKETPLVEVVDPKIVQTLGKVRQSSVQLDPEHHKKINLPPCASKGELGEKVIVLTEVLSNLGKINQGPQLNVVSRKNGKLSKPITTILPKLMSKKNRPMMSGRQQSGESLLPKYNLPVNLTEQNSDIGNESFSVRKSSNHVAIKQRRKEDKEEDRRNAKKDEWLEEQKTTLTPPMSKLEKIGRSSKPDRAIRKKKILPRILPKTMFKKKQSITSLKRHIGQQNFDVGIESFSIRKSANHFAKTSFSNEVVSTITSSTQSSATSSFETAGCVEKASTAPPTSKSKESSKVSKMDTDVEVLELKKPSNNQEVTEAVPKVIKSELDENQNHEATILCGICYKPFSKNAGALIAHGETHGGEFGGKGKRKCTQCIGFEGNRTRLLMHVRAKHTKEKLFRCEVCDDSFATCAAKKNHQKRH